MCLPSAWIGSNSSLSLLARGIDIVSCVFAWIGSNSSLSLLARGIDIVGMYLTKFLSCPSPPLPSKWAIELATNCNSLKMLEDEGAQHSCFGACPRISSNYCPCISSNHFTLCEGCVEVGSCMPLEVACPHVADPFPFFE